MILELDRLEQSELQYLLALAVEQRNALARRPEFQDFWQEMAGGAHDELARRFSPRALAAETRELMRIWSGNPSASGGWTGRNPSAD